MKWGEICTCLNTQCNKHRPHLGLCSVVLNPRQRFPLTDKEFCAFPVLWAVRFQAGSGIRIKTAQARWEVWGTKPWWSWGRSSRAHRKSPRTVLNTLCVKSPCSNSALSLLNMQGLRATSFLNAYAECLGNSLTQTAAAHNPTKYSLVMIQRIRCEVSAHHCWCLRIMIALLCINKDKRSYLYEFGIAALPFLLYLWAWWFSAQPQGLLLQMVKKNKATSSPGVIPLRVLQGEFGEGCVMLFACFFLWRRDDAKKMVG